MTLSTLIDKQDTAEIVRDQIAGILVTEVAAQMALATAASKDPNDWKLRVYTERANPWEEFPERVADETPIVNIWWDTASYDESGSDPVERQKTSAVYNLDCYGYGRAADVVGGGHSAGDKSATLEAQRAARLVRNILMAGEHTYLGLRKTVWRRWPNSITNFQPQQDDRNVAHVAGTRVAFRVEFNEYSPQTQPETLELLTIDIIREEDGQILVEADYDYTV